jgi:hypothetical protein
MVAIVSGAGASQRGDKTYLRLNPNLNRLGIATTMVLLGLLAGCGGSSGSDSAVVAPPTTATPLTAVPAAASATEAGFIGFLQQFSADDTAEPLTTDGVAPATSESSEPFAL